METKNRIYQIYELRDELKKALSNVELVEGQEKLLVSILIGSPHFKQFEDFVNGTKANWKEYESQKASINSRLKVVEHLISLHEKKDEKVDEIVSLTLEALGAVKPEKKK